MQNIHTPDLRSKVAVLSISMALVSPWISHPATANCDLTKTPEVQKEDLIRKLGSQLHDEWRAPRWKADLGKYDPREKTLKDGSVVDIANTDYANLPEQFQFENRETARVVVEQIFQQVAKKAPLDTGFVEMASNAVHDEWVKRNDWAPAEQKLPFAQLTKEEADKDRVMVIKGIHMFRERQKEILVFQLASQLHDEWRAPRWKADLGKYDPREKTLKDGSVVDIANTDYANLPEQFQFENRETARIVVEQIIAHFDAGHALDDAFIESASDVVHDKWVERNDWAPAEQKLPFAQLTKEEADKDRVMVRKGIEVFLK